MGKEESHRCKEVAIVERFKQESVYDLSAQKMPIVEINLFLVFTENTQPIAFILHQI